MGQQRISQAMERIEAALVRIERASADRFADRAAAGQTAGAALVARHEALRESVGATIAELDTLIGRLEA